MENTDEANETFILMDEDHTLAVALCHLLNKNPHVVFCGYAIPHPSDRRINIRVQTTGMITATEAMREAASNLRSVCKHISEVYKQRQEAFVEPPAAQPQAMDE